MDSGCVVGTGPRSVAGPVSPAARAVAGPESLVDGSVAGPESAARLVTGPESTARSVAGPESADGVPAGSGSSDMAVTPGSSVSGVTEWDRAPAGTSRTAPSTSRRSGSVRGWR